MPRPLRSSVTVLAVVALFFLSSGCVRTQHSKGHQPAADHSQKKKPSPGPSAKPTTTPKPSPQSADSVATRRERLLKAVEQLPNGSAARIVQPANPSALNDATARQLLTGMAKDADDPLLGNLENKVRAEAGHQ